MAEKKKIDYSKAFQDEFSKDMDYVGSDAFNEDASLAFGGGGLLGGSVKYGKDALGLYKRMKALKKANPNRTWKSLYKQWNKMNRKVMKRIKIKKKKNQERSE